MEINKILSTEKQRESEHSDEEIISTLAEYKTLQVMNLIDSKTICFDREYCLLVLLL